jgi:hypothetical protein
MASKFIRDRKPASEYTVLATDKRAKKGEELRRIFLTVASLGHVVVGWS